MSEMLADELHAFIAAAPHEYPGHLVGLFERAEKALRRCSAVSEQPVAWLPMSTAPRDRLPVLLKVKDRIPSDREDLRRWDGLIFVGRNYGDIQDWGFAAPVGVGGFPDEWFDGWNYICAQPQAAPMPQNVEVVIKRMKTLADTALPCRTYEEECQAQMRNACILLEMAYRSQAVSVPQSPLQDAVEKIAKQALSTETDGVTGDYEYGYDECVRVARAALTRPVCEGK